jgi:hypothetical protein
MILIVMLKSMYVNGLLVVNEFTRCMHVHLKCYRFISLWIIESLLKCV